VDLRASPRCQPRRCQRSRLPQWAAGLRQVRVRRQEGPQLAQAAL
jgi:hypothetical protein